jgi:hypothetical protein
MGRVGACGDNAAMESFFALLQMNVLDRKRWETREELRLAIVTWIEKTYHRRRRQAALGRLTRSSLRSSTQPQTPPEHHPPQVSTRTWAVPFDLTLSTNHLQDIRCLWPGSVPRRSGAASGVTRPRPSTQSLPGHT